jgi:nicotinate-nucleotide adenylyltransferase
MGVVKVGVMGGTFDPVHNGHIAMAREARDKLNLSYVVFVPAGNPWLKSDVPVTPAEQRLEMVKLAVESYPHFQVSRVEIDRPGPSYTVDTINELKARLGNKNELFFILGWDSLAQLPLWHRASGLVKKCRLVAVPRPGYTKPNLPALEKEIPGITKSMILLDIPLMDIAASDIRERTAHGLSLAGLVPEAVEKYIREKGLYRDRNGTKNCRSGK